MNRWSFCCWSEFQLMLTLPGSGAGRFGPAWSDWPPGISLLSALFSIPLWSGVESQTHLSIQSCLLFYVGLFLSELMFRFYCCHEQLKSCVELFGLRWVRLYFKAQNGRRQVEKRRADNNGGKDRNTTRNLWCVFSLIVTPHVHTSLKIRRQERYVTSVQIKFTGYY